MNRSAPLGLGGPPRPTTAARASTAARPAASPAAPPANQPFWQRWLLSALGVALGGMAMTVLTVVVIQGIALIANGGRVLEGEETAALGLFAGWIAGGYVGWVVLRRVTRWGRGGVFGMLLLWYLGYLLAWAIGANGPGLGLGGFVTVWLIYAVAAATLHTVAGGSRPAARPTRAGRAASGRPDAATVAGRQAVSQTIMAAAPTAAGRQAVAQTIIAAARSGGVAASAAQRPSGEARFGRIPVGTVEGLRQDVADVEVVVVRGFPGRVDRAIRDDTTRLVLGHVIADRWRRGYHVHLSEVERDDLASAITLAHTLATESFTNPALHPAAHRAMLTALLDDWQARRGG